MSRAQKGRAGITDPRRIAETVNQKTVQKGEAREVRRTFKPLREVWITVGIEKIDTHEGRTVKVLLDSGATGMFMSKGLAQKEGYRLIKLDQPLQVKNVDGTGNSEGAIIHEVEVNMFYKGHVEKVRMDICELGKTDVILGMPWLAAHNPEINWEKGEVRMTRCPPLCGKAVKIKGKKETREDERKIVRWAVDEKEDWEREEKIEVDHRKIEEMVARRAVDTSVHSGQAHLLSVVCALREFFTQHPDTSIDFWDCPSKAQWSLHHLVHEDVTNTRIAAGRYPATSLDALCSKSTTSCLDTWRSSFSHPSSQGRHFLSLKGSNRKPLQPSYTKGGSWLPFIAESVTLCARTTRAILNHAPIGEFRQCFFPAEYTQCPCGHCQVETR